MIGPLWTPKDMAVLGQPVNCWTSALKLVVLAFRSVVGVLLEALDLLLAGLNAILLFGVNWLAVVVLAVYELFGLKTVTSDDDTVAGHLAVTAVAPENHSAGGAGSGAWPPSIRGCWNCVQYWSVIAAIVSPMG